MRSELRVHGKNGDLPTREVLVKKTAKQHGVILDRKTLYTRVQRVQSSRTNRMYHYPFAPYLPYAWYVYPHLPTRDASAFIFIC